MLRVEELSGPMIASTPRDSQACCYPRGLRSPESWVSNLISIAPDHLVFRLSLRMSLPASEPT